MVSAPGFLNVQTLVAGVVVLLLIAVGLYYIRRRMRGDENDDSGEGRVESSQRARDREKPSLSTWTRTAALTWPAKALLAGIIVFLIVGVWNIYTYLKTGSPTQMAYARETQLVALGLGTFVTGVWWARRQYAREGIVDIEYEPVPGSGRSETVTERIYFDPDDVVATDDGLVVHEYSDSRFLKAYRQPKRVADDKQLRNDEDVRRPLADKVGHRIPDHATQLDDNHWEIRTKGQRTTRSPEMMADYIYGPPFSMSQERKMQIEQDIEEMMSRVEQKERKLAHKDELIRELETMLENARTENWRDLIEVMQQVAPLVGRGFSNQKVLQQLPDQAFQTHSARDGEAQQGEPANGTATAHGGGGRD